MQTTFIDYEVERRHRDDHAQPARGRQRPDARAARRPRRGVAPGGRRPRRAGHRPPGQRQALLGRPRHQAASATTTTPRRSGRSPASTRPRPGASSSTRCAGATCPSRRSPPCRACASPAGCCCAWPCDLIIAADNAKFSDPVVNMGIGGVEYHGHTWEWGARKAKELLFTGRAMTAAGGRAASAWSPGSCPLDDLRAETRALAAEIATQAPVRPAPGQAGGQPDPRRAGLLRRDPVGLRHPPDRPRPRPQRVGPADPHAPRRHEGRDRQDRRRVERGRRLTRPPGRAGPGASGPRVRLHGDERDGVTRRWPTSRLRAASARPGDTAAGEAAADRRRAAAASSSPASSTRATRSATSPT